jgi:predicted short-subunit dehydrogenase-like oxidoreductase (DUF2520 family)
VIELAIIGRGRVGVALVEAFTNAGLRVESHSARALPPSLDAPTYLLCVRDAQLEAVAREVLAHHVGFLPVLVHTAGGVPSSRIAQGAAGAAMLHPLVAFAGSTPTLRQAVFGIEGDAVGRQTARRLCDKLGGRALELDAAQLPTYHAAAVLASNNVLGLVAHARALLASLGLDDRDAMRGLSSLFSAVAANLASLGLPDALTGPIARGDVATVESHLDALASHPDADAAYRATAPALVELARQKAGTIRGGLHNHLDAILAVLYAARKPR